MTISPCHRETAETSLTTDATGLSFLSYRRSRIAEARLLIEAQHNVGIPTWHDLKNLDAGHTDELLREVLADKSTANAICWLTPDIKDSTVITKTELPGIVQRTERKDGFFMQPVAAGGLDYDDIAGVVGTYLGTHDLSQWNVNKMVADPITAQDAAEIARRILTRRMKEVSRQLATNAPLRLVLNTRKPPALESGVALSLDWTHNFNGRIAYEPSVWSDSLLPALEAVAQAIEQNAWGRTVIAEGLCSLPSAVALGATFLSTRRLPLAWRQFCPARPPEIWSLQAAVEPSGFESDIIPNNPSADDIALLVSVNSNVEPAFGASKPILPAFRGMVAITKQGSYPHDIGSPGQATHIVRVIGAALREARDALQPRGTIHLFLAVPAGLAVMIGQTLNTFGPVQTYEYTSIDTVGRYEPVVLLHPSS